MRSRSAGGYTKAPDYCFRIGGTRKFFVEAKNPAVDIRQDASPAFQLRRYAWSAKLPLSILTDFNGRSIASFSSGSARTAASSRKAGGVFYTPTYIVEYIVRNTVDKLLEGKMPKEAAKLAILDPACGSGSFLIGAFQRLLDWHRDWYVDNGKEKWAKGNAPTPYQGPGGEWRLTTTKRKEILLNNIYGVDIDSQAVEVTKLSLLLKFVVVIGHTENGSSNNFPSEPSTSPTPPINPGTTVWSRWSSKCYRSTSRPRRQKPTTRRRPFSARSTQRIGRSTSWFMNCTC